MAKVFQAIFVASVNVLLIGSLSVGAINVVAEMSGASFSIAHNADNYLLCMFALFVVYIIQDFFKDEKTTP